jgi:8-oxo-dGTP pyrophosphatase MutT (NUDIX family)
MRIGSGGSPVHGKRAAGIFFTDGKSVLLLKRSNDGDHSNTWALPGGKNKDGESDIGAAIRETKEETGLRSIPGYRICSLPSKNGQQTFTGFIYKVSSPFDVKISHEHTDWEWVGLKDLKSKVLHPKFKEQIPRYLSQISRKIRSFSEWEEFRESIDCDSD